MNFACIIVIFFVEVTEITEDQVTTLISWSLKYLLVYVVS